LHRFTCTGLPGHRREGSDLDWTATARGRAERNPVPRGHPERSRDQAGPSPTVVTLIEQTAAGLDPERFSGPSQRRGRCRRPYERAQLAEPVAGAARRRPCSVIPRRFVAPTISPSGSSGRPSERRRGRRWSLPVGRQREPDNGIAPLPASGARSVHSRRVSADCVPVVRGQDHPAIRRPVRFWWCQRPWSDETRISTPPPSDLTPSRRRS
jgi:hypothetical protein